MSDLIVQQSIILICKVLEHHYNCNKRNKKYFLMKNFHKFDTYKNATIRNNLPHQSFQSLLKLWSLD